MRAAAAAKTVPMEVDVRGMNLEEATEAVDTYLADAVHGRAQRGQHHSRQGHRRFAHRHPEAFEAPLERKKSFRDGMYGEGEQGVTVVTLK